MINDGLGAVMDVTHYLSYRKAPVIVIEMDDGETVIAHLSIAKAYDLINMLHANIEACHPRIHACDDGPSEVRGMSAFLKLHHEVTRETDVRYQREFFDRGFEPDDMPDWRWKLGFWLIVIGLCCATWLLAVKGAIWFINWVIQ